METNASAPVPNAITSLLLKLQRGVPIAPRRGGRTKDEDRVAAPAAKKQSSLIQLIEELNVDDGIIMTLSARKELTKKILKLEKYEGHRYTCNMTSESTWADKSKPEVLFTRTY